MSKTIKNNIHLKIKSIIINYLKSLYKIKIINHPYNNLNYLKFNFIVCLKLKFFYTTLEIFLKIYIKYHTQIYFYLFESLYE